MNTALYWSVCSCACRQGAAAAFKQHYTEYGTWPSPQQLPMLYSDVYNVSFLGIENLHVFDSKKFRKIVATLEREKLITRKQVQLHADLQN